MAKYMGLQPFGTNLMLRYSIRHRMKRIKQDDKAIDYEGIEALSVPELQHACASRGIKTYGVSPGKLREDLEMWLELRLHQKVPSTLLVLSSAYSYGVDTEKLNSYYDGILAVLSGIPEELYHEAELEVSSAAATNKQRLEVLKEQQELIRDENREEEASGHVIKVNDNLSLEDEEAETKLSAPESETKDENAKLESPATDGKHHQKSQDEKAQ
jgi:LETM1 and EF-hand domain-containing protein 1